eukprot:3429894-Amphidinium_carterae.1
MEGANPETQLVRPAAGDETNKMAESPSEMGQSGETTTTSQQSLLRWDSSPSLDLGNPEHPHKRIR